MQDFQPLSSTASEAKAGSKRKMSHRPSCDVCKLRKTRCDHKDKVDERALALSTTYDQLSPSEVAKLSCSLCLSHGLDCTFEHWDKSTNRNGRRLVDIQRSQLQQIVQQAESTVQRSGTIAHPPSDGHTTSSGLLGVEGMTKSLLEYCFKMFFRYVAPIRPILHAERFRGAYNNYCLPRKLQVEPLVDDLLLLAVASLGASLLEPPIAERGSTAKFELESRCIQRYVKVFSERDWTDWYTKSNVSDVMEAICLMSEILFDPLDVEHGVNLEISTKNEEKNNLQQSLLEKGSSSSEKLIKIQTKKDVLRKDILSHDFLIEMATKMRLCQSPKPRSDCPIDDPKIIQDAHGVFVTAAENFRRKRIFWNVFAQDTFCCFGQRRMPRIRDDDHDLDLPRLYAPNASERNNTLEGGGSAHGPLYDYSIYQAEDASRLDIPQPNPSPANVFTQPARFARFDGLFLEVNLRLVFVIRAIVIYTVSPRSQGKGVRVKDVDRALSALETWREHLPIEVRWDTNYQPLLELKMKKSTNQVNLDTVQRNAIKALLMEYLYHAAVLCMWRSVQEFGLRIEKDMIELVSLHVFRTDVEDPPCLQSPDAVMQRIERRGFQSFYEIANVAKEAQGLNLLRCSRTAFLGMSASCVIQGIDMAKSKKKDDPAAFDRIVGCCEDLIKAISEIDSYSNAQTLCLQMKAKLDHLKADNLSSWLHSDLFPGVSIGDDITMLSSNAQHDVAEMSNSWLSDWLSQETFETWPNLSPIEGSLTASDDIQDWIFNIS